MASNKKNSLTFFTPLENVGLQWFKEEQKKKNEGKKGAGMKYLITNGARKEM